MLGRIAQELIESPLVSGALQRGFEARERAAQAQEAAMGALNLPSASDLERLTRRVRSVAQRLEGMEDGVDRLADRLRARPPRTTPCGSRRSSSAWPRSTTRSPASPRPSPSSASRPRGVAEARAPRSAAAEARGGEACGQAPPRLAARAPERQLAASASKAARPRRTAAASSDSAVDALTRAGLGVADRQQAAPRERRARQPPSGRSRPPSRRRSRPSARQPAARPGSGS